MANALDLEKQQQMLALGKLGWTLRRIEQAVRLGRNATVIWQDLVDDYGFAGGDQSVRRFAAKLRGARVPEAHPVIETAPGEEGRVDYGGGGPMVRDASTGKYRRMRLLVFALGSSRKSVRLLTFKSSLQIWAELHEEAFHRPWGAPPASGLPSP